MDHAQGLAEDLTPMTPLKACLRAGHIGMGRWFDHRRLFRELESIRQPNTKLTTTVKTESQLQAATHTVEPA